MEDCAMSVATMHGRGESEGAPHDDLTHEELCLLYRESADTIRFAKGQQWRSLGAALLVLAGLMTVGQYNADSRLFVSLLGVISVLLGCGVIYVLVIYQNWQNTERAKLRFIADRLSATAQAVRAIKSHQEANLFRYLLLGFMILSMIIGTAVALGHLARLLS
jgi:hypothetical protein